MDRMILLLCLLFAFPAVMATYAAPPEKYTPSEKARITAARTPDERIRIYDEAFERLGKKAREIFQQGEFDSLPDILTNISDLLGESLADIEANIRPHAKSQRLIRYEINLRQLIKDFRSRWLRVPEEHQDAFQNFLDQAEATRQKFMDIIFIQD